MATFDPFIDQFFRVAGLNIFLNHRRSRSFPWYAISFVVSDALRDQGLSTYTFCAIPFLINRVPHLSKRAHSFGVASFKISVILTATCLFACGLVVSAFCRNALFVLYSGPA